MPDEIVHDAEYYILYDQHGERWEVEDSELDTKLAELRGKYGTPPNIVHIMWDDMPFGDAGIPALNKIRGFDTPGCNRMAAEGALFTRMYTEPACTPSRAAVMTGRHPVRSGMYAVAFPIEMIGLAGEEMTTAEVLSEAGYATAFYGKWHLGDLEESYPHNQGFDETLFTPYNQALSLWNQMGEIGNANLGLHTEVLADDPYAIDEHFRPEGWVMTIEGKKGEQGREWEPPSKKQKLQEMAKEKVLQLPEGDADFTAIDPECEKRTIEFIRRNAADKKPFYVAYWPNFTTFMPVPRPKQTPGRGVQHEGMASVDGFVAQLMDELRALGIAENTLVVAMADNGPMVHGIPPHFGFNETVFRGGKGDYWEGGIRVAAFAWWPGMIEAGQVIGDMIHETDLFTTFARIGGAKQHIPRDRIIDGIDQTALLVNGDTNGRRDYNFVYTGPILAATIKQQIKRVWIGADPSLPGVAFYDLYLDPREVKPMMVPLLWSSSAMTRMRKRHELWKKEYPDRPAARGVPFTGLENARPETQALANPPVDLEKLPFDPLQYVDVELPWDGLDQD